MEDQQYKEDWEKRLWSKSINRYNQTLKEKLILDKSNIVLKSEKTPKQILIKREHIALFIDPMDFVAHQQDKELNIVLVICEKKFKQAKIEAKEHIRVKPH